MKQMIASKAFSYRNRALRAGDLFEASDRDARVLEAIRRARLDMPREVGELPPPPAEVSAKIEAERVTREDLVAKARALGIYVDGRWSAARVQQALNDARSS